MTDARQFVLYAAIFLVIAVVMVSVRDITEALTPTEVQGYGPDALPFVCDFTRDGASPDDMEARFTIAFDAAGDGPFPHCATLTRGTELRPRNGTETVCLAHHTDARQDIWADNAGGTLTIHADDGARYVRRERPHGADAFAATTDIAYSGACMKET